MKIKLALNTSNAAQAAKLEAFYLAVMDSLQTPGKARRP